jgi:hypothetical protein
MLKRTLVVLFNFYDIGVALQKHGKEIIMEDAQIVLKRHERKLEEIDNQPKNRLNQIITAIIAAISGGVIT